MKLLAYQIVIIITLAVSGVGFSMLAYYLSNMTEKKRAKFWLVLYVFLIAILIAMLCNLDEQSTALELICLLTLCFELYLMYYLHNSYGRKALAEYQIKVSKQDLMMSTGNLRISKSNTYESIGFYDIDELINETKKAGENGFYAMEGLCCKAIPDSEINKEYYAGIQTICEDDVKFPKHNHVYKEFFKVLVGELKVKGDLLVKAGETGVVMELESHYYIAKKGTIVNHYFKKNN